MVYCDRGPDPAMPYQPWALNAHRRHGLPAGRITFFHPPWRTTEKWPGFPWRDTGEGLPLNIQGQHFSNLFSPPRRPGTGPGPFPSPTGLSSSTKGSSGLESTQGHGAHLHNQAAIAPGRRPMPEPKAKILVIDDEEAICRNCEKILTRSNYEVKWALNGYKAHGP